MHRNLVVSLVAAASALFVVAANADSPDATPDVRCALVGFNLVNSQDIALQKSGLMAAYYYMGRLDGRSPKLDIEALFAEQTVKMTPADWKAEAIRCGAELVEKGKEWKLLGQHLVDLGKQQELKEQQQKP